MTVVPLAEASRQLGGFYVPRFEIRVEGAGLPDDVLRDVTEVRYKDNVDQLDSFQLTVNNWHTEEKVFKYMGAETPEILNRGDDRAKRYKLFEPCDKEVQLSMGYAPVMKLMMTGTFVTMEPEFQTNAAPILKVRGLNILHQLRRKKYDDAFENKKDSEIAEIIGRRRDRKLRAPRFPLRIRISESAKQAEESIPFVAQKKEFDIDFLWKRARHQGYVVVIEEESDEHPRQLYFGPSEQTENRITYELEWGKSLIQFSPRLTTANQFKSVTVNGWNRRRQKPISVKIDFTDREIRRLNSDLHEMICKCDPREEYVVDEPVFTENQARRRARALLLDQHKQMVKATGKTVGLPELRAGANVEITGVGSRLNGTYFITQTEHILNDSGYITQFQGRRETRNAPEQDQPCGEDN
jgi:phage protein D